MPSYANVNSETYGQSLFSNTSSLSSGNVNVLQNSFRIGTDALNASILKGGGKRRRTINRRRIRRISNRYKMRGKSKSFRKQMKSRLQKRTRHNRK